MFTRIARQLTAVTVTALMIVPLTAVASGAHAGGDHSHLESGVNQIAAVDVVRYGGADRYATSLLVAEAIAAESDGRLDAVVLVSGRVWTDAVVAAALASDVGAPVLLTPPDGLGGDASGSLQQIGASSATIVSTDPEGETPAVAATVGVGLTEAGLAVERVSGGDQYATSVAVARLLSRVGKITGFGRTAIVASGEVFADALVAGPFAAHGSFPVLLTPQNRLHQSVASYLSDADIDHVVLMGGAAATAPAVESSIRSMGISVARIAGATRFETATRFAAYAQRSAVGCFDGDQIGLARADVPFDAFSSARLLAEHCAPLLLANTGSIPATTANYLSDARRGNDHVTLHVFGGNAAVSQGALDAYLSANPGSGVKHYKNRSPRSALPAADKYFVDHDEVAALFPTCGLPPEYHPNTLARMDYQQALYGGFDRELTEGIFNGRQRDFASGWWTDDKLHEVYKNTYPEITVEWAKRRVTMWSNGQIGFGWRPHLQGPDWMTVPSAGRPGYRGLYDRIAMDGFVSHSIKGAQEFTNHYGIRNPRRVDPNDAAWIDQGGRLLWDWTTFMTQFPPVDREPAAWGMRTLLQTRHPACVARQMLAICDDPITDATSPHLRHDSKASPLGYALRNLICGEHPIS